MKKQLLFVINTLGKAGAEMALLEVLRNISPEEYDIDLFVLLGQGELITKVPIYVNVLNENYDEISVLSEQGRKLLRNKVLKAFFSNGRFGSKISFLVSNFWDMKRNKNVKMDKLLWRLISDSALRISKEYDLAIAYLEGGATYYVADYVKAKKKAAFVHIDYGRAGYTKKLDQDCYEKIDTIYTVSEEVSEKFLRVYPEHKNKIKVFENIVNQGRIRELAEADIDTFGEYEGLKLLTVGRLTSQKGYEYAIEALKILRNEGVEAKWYILGDGDQYSTLKKEIAKADLNDYFVLLGAVDNPYPYYRDCDIYVHATMFEGKSIAIQEAKTLGCAVVASDRSGNREQIIHEENGLLCKMESEDIARNIIRFYKDENLKLKCKEAAAKEIIDNKDQIKKLLLT